MKNYIIIFYDTENQQGNVVFKNHFESTYEFAVQYAEDCIKNIELTKSYEIKT